MEASRSILPDDVDALRAIITAQADQLAEQARKLQSRDTLIDKGKAQLVLLKRARFGSSSEKVDRASSNLNLRWKISSVLPERRVTFHTGDMGYTFCLCEESEGALAGV